MNLKNRHWNRSTWVGSIVLIIYIFLLFVNISGQSLFSIDSIYYGLLALEILPFTVLIVFFFCSLKQWKHICNYRQDKIAENPSYKLSFFNIPKNLFIKALACSMGTMWSAGWILYTCALWSNYKSDGNFAEILGYAAMSSLDLFMMDINGNILDNINGSNNDPTPFLYPRILKGSIILVSIFSAICTFAILINLFFSRFLSYIHSRNVKISSEENYKLFILWGTSDNARTLAKDIILNHKSKKNLVIFVDDENKDSDEIDGWNNVVSHLTLKNPLAAKLNDDRHTMYLVAERDICSLNPSKCVGSKFWLKLGLLRIDSLFNELVNANPQGDKKEIHFFFLSNNRDKNVLASRILIEHIAKDNRLNSIPKSVYCATRKDGATAVIEEMNSSDPDLLKVKVIDDASIAVENLKRQTSSSPITFVDLDLKNNVGTSKSNFCSLIVGFGETGRDVFRYLYEYSAILGQSHCCLSRIPFECHIVDRNINNLKGKLIANTPSIFNKNFNHLSDHNNIQFHEFADNSIEFYNLLDTIGHRLNYVVICTGNDEENITIATNILKYIRKYNFNLPKTSFKIFVRTYEDESFSHLESIVEHYNKIYGYDIISIFGNKEHIYSYQSIILDIVDKQASRFHNAYTEAAKEMDGSDGPNWDTLKRMMNYEIYLNNTPIKKVELRPEAIFDINRRINENKKNVFHLNQKIYIIRKFLEDLNKNPKYKDLTIQDLYQKIISFGVNGQERFSHIKATIEKSKEDTPEYKICRLIYNMCIFEHLRWNASHELLGFTTGEKLFRAKTHDCLKDWSNLDAYTPLYDYLVIETSLRIFIEMLDKGEDLSL